MVVHSIKHTIKHTYCAFTYGIPGGCLDEHAGQVGLQGKRRHLPAQCYDVPAVVNGLERVQLTQRLIVCTTQEQATHQVGSSTETVGSTTINSNPV